MMRRRLPRARVGLVLGIATLGVLAGGPWAMRSQSAVPGVVAVGISDQFPSTYFETPSLYPIPFWRTNRDVALWDALKSKQQVVSARFLIPWNAATRPAALAFADSWVTSVERDGLAPFLVLQGQNSGKVPPTAAAYRTAFAALVDHFEQLAAKNGAPPITLWQSWNEPNVPVNHTANPVVGAAIAADYWREANDVLTSYWSAHALSGCTVVAGEFANLTRGSYERGGYVYYYLEEVLSRSASLPPVVYPAIWGYHSYVDLQNGWRTKPPYSYPTDLATECTTDLHGVRDYQQERGYAFQQTDCFVNYIAGGASNGWDQGAAWHNPHVWLDEEGVFLGSSAGGPGPLDATFVSLGDDAKPKSLNPNWPAPLGGWLATRRQVAAATEFTNFGSRYDGLVQRVYYFDWGQGALAGFDSALIDSTDKPRVAYCVLASQPIANCDGSTTYVTPPPPPGHGHGPPSCLPTEPGKPITCK